MSRIFIISGNFMQHGRWSEPDPSFVGKIVVDETDNFFGICEELYDCQRLGISRTRYLVGAFAPNGRNGRRGIAFYKMSNDPEQVALMYVVPDLTDPSCGSWAALSMFGVFQAQGKARIMVEEEAFSEQEERRIATKYEALNRNLNSNEELIDQIDCCKNILVHAR